MRCGLVSDFDKCVVKAVSVEKNSLHLKNCSLKSFLTLSLTFIKCDFRDIRSVRLHYYDT